MLRPRWRKVLRDLWGNKIRTLLVILSIAIGVFATGMIVGTQVLLREDLSFAYSATNPSSATLATDPFDADLLYSIRKLDGVAEAEARQTVNIPLQVGADEWKQMNLIVRADYEAMQIHTISPVTGKWPPPYRGLLVERDSLRVMNAEIGDTVVVETPDGHFRELVIEGTAYDIFADPVQFTNQPNAFITLDTLEWLGYPRSFDAIHIIVEGDKTDKEHIEAIADIVQAKIEKSGRTVYFTFIPEPGEHPANTTIQSLLAILGVLGLMSLGASALLVINIINALLAQHTQQIGIMKAIGARKGQIVQMYMVAVIIFGLLSLLIAMPLGGLAAYGLTSYLASLVNFDLLGFRIPTQAIIVEVAVAILDPVLAALVPVFRGAGITVQEALSEPKIIELLGEMGVHISDGAVSNLLTKNNTVWHSEAAEVLQAGLVSTSWQHIDDTATRVNGVNQHCHVLSNPFYTAYATHPRKNRLTVIAVLQGTSEPTYLLNDKTTYWLDIFAIPQWVRQHMGQWPQAVLLTGETMAQLVQRDLATRLNEQQQARVLEAAALTAYYSQTSVPIVPILVSDDAPQFRHITEEQALCWIHEGRHYKKLTPFVDLDFGQAEQTNNITIGPHLTKLMEKLTAMPVMEAVEPLSHP